MLGCAAPAAPQSTNKLHFFAFDGCKEIESLFVGWLLRPLQQPASRKQNFLLPRAARRKLLFCSSRLSAFAYSFRPFHINSFFFISFQKIKLMFHYPKGIVSNYCYNIFLFPSAKQASLNERKIKLKVLFWKKWSEGCVPRSRSIKSIPFNSIDFLPHGPFGWPLSSFHFVSSPPLRSFRFSNWRSINSSSWLPLGVAFTSFTLFLLLYWIGIVNGFLSSFASFRGALLPQQPLTAQAAQQEDKPFTSSNSMRQLHWN